MTATTSTAGNRCRVLRRAFSSVPSSAIRAGHAPEHDGELTAAFGALIEDARAGRIDHAFAALAMSLPTEADIAREIGQDVDPDAVYVARKTMRGALGRAHAEGLAALHAELANSSPFSPDAAAAGRRALRNVALSLFVDGDVIEGLELAHRQIAEANNMTERLGALTAIALQARRCARACARRVRPALRDGAPHSRQMVLASGAVIPEHETLDSVRALMNHRGFSLANPNRVRALIGGFSANQTQFNRLDGAGFDLLEEWSFFSTRPTLRSPRGY